jgi:Predicted membrane protein (DUF2207)
VASNTIVPRTVWLTTRHARAVSLAPTVPSVIEIRNAKVEIGRYNPSALMPRRFLLLLAAFVCSLHAFAGVRAKSFDASIMLDTDGAAVVSENIGFAAPQPQFVRAIPVRTPGHEDTPLIIRVLKVQDEHGADLKWHQYRSGGLQFVRVDAATSVVRLLYLIPNATRFAGDHDEYVWPATDQWVGMDAAEVRLSLPDSAAGHFRAQAFSTAAGGFRPIAVWSSTGALPIETEGATARTNSPGPMREGAAITVGVFVDKGVLAQPGSLTRAGWYVGANRIMLLPFAALAVMMLIRRLRPSVPRRAIATCYDPPEGLTPAEVGTLADDHVDARDVAATLADLAVRGYIRFDAITSKSADEHLDPDFKITLLRPPDEWRSLRPHEHTTLFHTFYGGHWTQLSSLRLRFPSIVPLFTDDVMSALRAKRLYSSLEYSPWIICQLGFAAVAAVLFFAQLTGIVSLFDSPWTALASVALSAVVIFVLGGKLSSKTRRGQRVWVDVRGFEEFLDRVDADRLERLTPDLYEKYLPYAMALGVEHGWTAAFDGIAVPLPEWFGADGGITDPTRFHEALHAFVEHTIHEVRTAKPPRVKLSARTAKAN